jgi:RNA polymerase sigma-B factor
LRLEVNRAAETLTQALGRRPSPADLASYLGVPEAEITECLTASQNYHPVSLSTPLGPDDTHELADAVGAEDPGLALVEYRQSVGPLLAALTPHEREVVALRFFGEMTQSQIAARVGSSQMHVSRLLTSVLRRLRGALAEQQAAPAARTRELSAEARADDPAARSGATAVTRSARPPSARPRPRGRPGPARSS